MHFSKIMKMKELISEEKNTVYDHLMPDDKHYFGGFLSLAQSNIDSIIREFCSRLNRTYNEENPDGFLDFFTERTSYTDWERGINILKEYLPVISYIDLPATDTRFNLPPYKREKVRREYFGDALQTLFSAVRTLTGYYSSYYHAPVDLPDKLFDLLDDVLLHTVKDVRKQKMKNDRARQLLKNSLGTELAQLIADKKEELKEKKRPAIKTDNEYDLESAVLNDAFSHLLYKSRESNRELVAKRYSAKAMDDEQAPPEIGISPNGLTFLLSMFLDRKEIEQFKSNIKGHRANFAGKDANGPATKRQNSLKLMATHWVFSVLAFKGVKRRITSCYEKETLLMQMIDELSKVPDEVYQLLPDESKNQFLEDMNDFAGETVRDDENQPYAVHPVIRKRYESKFNYFAVRFLDEYANFPTLRFQVYAGQYLHDNRTKALPGGKLITERMIKEKINVFGKLSEVVEKKNEYFKRRHPSDTGGWELFPNPSYNFMANNIHVHIDLFSQGDQKAEEIQRHINRVRDGKTRDEERDRRIGKDEIIRPVFGELPVNPSLILSTNELMSILHRLLVKGESEEEIERHIVKKMIEKYDLLTGFAPEQKTLHKNDLPKKLLKSETEDRIDLDKLMRAIDEEIKKGDRKLEMIRHNETEIHETQDRKSPGAGKSARKYTFYAGEKWKEATWIANDLKRFMSASAREQWKGIQHSELQRLFSHYEVEFAQARELVQTAWEKEIGIYWRDMFLGAFGERRFADFYAHYLEQRRYVLTGFYRSIENFRDEPKMLKKILTEIFIVFDERFYRINATDKHIEELLAKPFAFSRGLFDDKPTAIPGHNPRENPELFAGWYAYAYSYPPDRFQPFYRTEREYGPQYRAKAEQGTLPKLEGRDENYRMQRFRMSCDMEIKRIRFQDVYVKLMADRLYEGIFGQAPAFDLDRVCGDSADGRATVANPAWEQTIPVTLFGGRIADRSIRIKDIATVRRFAEEPEIETLLAYEPEHEPWSMRQLEDELESYDTIRRQELLKTVHQFEKDITTLNADAGSPPNAGFGTPDTPDFKTWTLNSVLRRTRGMTESRVAILDRKLSTIVPGEIERCDETVQKAWLLIYLHDRFEHNRLPAGEAYGMMKQLYPDIALSPSYAIFFHRVARRIAGELYTARRDGAPRKHDT
jgi:hypothetical protein